MENEKRQYRVRPGCRFGARDEFAPGSILDLTPYEAGGFLDKLEEVKVEAEAKVEVEASDNGQHISGKRKK